MKRLLLSCACMLLGGASFASAQQACDLIQSRQFQSIGAGAVTYIGGPVFRCTTGATISADSAIHVEATKRIDFIGNVRFNETDRSLTSQYAQYVPAERRLMAQQNVVLIDHKNGSTLRALSLDYFQKSPTNPEARIDVHAGRPRATLVRQRTDTAAVDTTIVDADRMQIIDDNVFRGWGSVDVTRGKIKSHSSFAEFDQNGSYMRFYGLARVESDTFRLAGDSIDVETVNRDQFKSVLARRDAKLDSRDAQVEAPSLLISFDSGKVSRMVAVGGSRKGEGEKQARSVSQDFTVVADSIDAKSPGEKLENVTAIGTARGERTPDSLDLKLPELIQRDWVRGDTVQAFFETETGTGTAQRDSVVLKRLVAKGAPASSTYRMKERSADTGADETSVNYLTARSIDVLFVKGEVDRVKAEGDIKGVYLQVPARAQK